MRKIFVVTALSLMICACAGREKQLVADPAIVPAFPPPPVDTSRPVGEPMLPDLQCLQDSGSPCLGAGSSAGRSSVTLTVLRIWFGASGIGVSPMLWV